MRKQGNYRGGGVPIPVTLESVGFIEFVLLFDAVAAPRIYREGTKAEQKQKST